MRDCVSAQHVSKRTYVFKDGRTSGWKRVGVFFMFPLTRIKIKKQG